MLLLDMLSLGLFCPFGIRRLDLGLGSADGMYGGLAAMLGADFSTLDLCWLLLLNFIIEVVIRHIINGHDKLLRAVLMDQVGRLISKRGQRFRPFDGT